MGETNPFNDDEETAPLTGKVEAVVVQNLPTESEIKIISIGYLLAMGICGLVLVALGATLDDIAANMGLRSTDLGTVFIARGCGAVCGAIFSSFVFSHYKGNDVLFCTLSAIVVIMLLLPFCTSVFLLHIEFLFLGLMTAITDTGCQIMTRKIHGKKAGPWLGANTVAFGISGSVVPVIQIISSRLTAQYIICSLIVVFVAIWIRLGPNPEEKGRLANPKNPKGLDIVPDHFRVEFVISFMVFCLVGGKVAATAYLETYVVDTQVIDVNNKESLVLVFWICIAIGRFAGIQDQRFLTNSTLPVHLGILLIGGAMGMLLILLYPNSSQCLWVGVASYGLLNGPCVGYCYDWNNRLTYPTELSMSIVMFGLNLGASVVPYILTVVWNYTFLGPYALPYLVMASMLLPFPFLVISQSLSYDPTVNPQIVSQSPYRSFRSSTAI
jgi:predicted MFS family arabinose efflux permease